VDAAQERWRRFNGHEVVAEVLAGATYTRTESSPPDDIDHDHKTDEKVAAGASSRQLIHNIWQWLSISRR